MTAPLIPRPHHHPALLPAERLVAMLTLHCDVDICEVMEHWIVSNSVSFNSKEKEGECVVD